MANKRLSFSKRQKFYVQYIESFGFKYHHTVFFHKYDRYKSRKIFVFKKMGLEIHLYSRESKNPFVFLKQGENIQADTSLKTFDFLKKNSN